MKLLQFASVALTLTACASHPAERQNPGAIEAAKALISSHEPWAAQASYALKQNDRVALVTVSCWGCKNPDGSPVSASYVVQVASDGKATIVSGP